MSHNSFGHLFRFTTFGESHGPAIGVVVDGCPPGLNLTHSWVQSYLDRRKPGGPLASQRQEPDEVLILSGVYEGKTTGTPIAMLIANVDARSKDYAEMPPRPGHADGAYQAKYGRRDPRGGGRASARETACRVAAGAVARLVVAECTITSRVVSVGPFDNPGLFADQIGAARAGGDSLGGVVETIIEGVPAGWGAPVYGKLEADLAAAIMSIPACKAFELGDGLLLARSSGSGAVDTGLSHGGIGGGISEAGPIRFRGYFKPTASTPLAGVKGRHDPCVAWRAPPVAEAMAAIVLADHKLRHRGQCG